MLATYLRLARPTQWIKCLFVVIGPAYAALAGDAPRWTWVALAAAALALCASGCYVVNDIRDRDADREHPRKRLRPIASGAVPVSSARAFALALIVAGLGLAGGTLALAHDASERTDAWILLGIAGLYVANVTAYSAGLKRVVVVDVISLASGFVLRILAGCAAAGVDPSAWLLNCTFFLSMFLAFGKRLGERRTMGAAAPAARAVQATYTDDILRMLVVVTGVALLVTYSGYVQNQVHAPLVASRGRAGFGMLWLTMLPATFGLLRCIVLVENGAYDDPTELAMRDRAFQAAVAVFALLTLGLVLLPKVLPL